MPPLSQGLLTKLRSGREGAAFVVDSLYKSLSNPRVQASFVQEIHDCHDLIEALVGLGHEIVGAAGKGEKPDWAVRSNIPHRAL